MMVAEYVDIPEAARILGVTEGRIRQLVADGKIEYKRVSPTQIPLTAVVERMQSDPKSGRPRKSKRKK